MIIHNNYILTICKEKPVPFTFFCVSMLCLMMADLNSRNV